MLIVAIHGGLGNQMFQYAFGYSIQKQKQTRLLLDTTMFNEKTIHNGFELTRLFSIKTSVATPGEIKQLIRWRATRVGREIMARRRYGILRGKRYFKEEAPKYLPWYEVTNKLGKFKRLDYTNGVSTSEIINRIKANRKKDALLRD